MHEQEFERSVQKKMEELSFQPSAPVWEKLEKGLGAGKKRRRLALWLLPATLVGLGAALWIFNGFEFGSPKDEVSENKPMQNEIATESARSGVSSKQPKSYSAEKPATKQTIVNEAATKLTATTKSSKKASSQHNRVKTFSSINTARVKNAIIKQNQNSAEKVGFFAKDQAVPGAHVYPTVNTAIPLLSLYTSTNLQSLQSEQQVTPVLVPSLKKAAPAARWQWSYEAQYGWATTNNGGLFNANKSVFLNDPSQNSSGGFGGGISRQPGLQKAPGAFLTTAINLHRSVSSRASISAGIRYSLYTLRLRVGQKVNAGNLIVGNASAEALASRALYKPDTANAFFKSRYHLIAVPVALHVQPFNKLPLEGEVGLGLGYLSGSKMLRYDTAARLFYVAKPAVQHFQLQAQLAVRYPLAQTGKWLWLGGVQVHYHFTDLYSGSNRDKKLYALSAGIQVRKK